MQLPEKLPGRLGLPGLLQGDLDSHGRDVNTLLFEAPGPEPMLRKVFMGFTSSLGSLEDHRRNRLAIARRYQSTRITPAMKPSRSGPS